MDDQDLLTPLVPRALTGDRSALDALCRGLEGPVFRLSLRILSDVEDARDATQEILVQVVTHLAQFRGESRLSTWVYRIAVRDLLKRKTRRERQREVESVLEMIDRGLSFTEVPALPEAEATMLAKETRLACTQSMLESLSREDRVAIALAEILGADDRLGAELCEITAPAYRQRLSRARKRLQPLLEQRCGAADPALPCTCAHQAAVKRLVQLPARRWPELKPDPGQLHRAFEQLGALERLTNVFGWDPPLGAPTEVWRSIQRQLPDVFPGA